MINEVELGALKKALREGTDAVEDLINLWQDKIKQRKLMKKDCVEISVRKNISKAAECDIEKVVATSFCKGVFAMHRDLDQPKKRTITHLPTGNFILAKASLRNAVKAMQYLEENMSDELLDSMNTNDMRKISHAITQEFREIIHNARAIWEGGK